MSLKKSSRNPILTSRHQYISQTNRQKYSKIVGLWQTEIGQSNEVSHLWVSPDLNARTDARARLGQDESWREFQGRGRPYLLELNNVLLQPTNFSPLK